MFNHNMETVERLYKPVRPGARYAHSLDVLKQVKTLNPSIFTKSGIMVGLGETDDEVAEMMDHSGSRCGFYDYWPVSSANTETCRC